MKLFAYHRGFTLIELIIVMALLAIIAMFAIPSFSGYQRDTQVGSIAETIVSQMRFAQAKSVGGVGTNKWGVHLDTAVANEHFFSIFQGASYAAGTDKEPIYLRDTAVLSNISLNGGGNDILFDRLTGLTSQYGTGASNRAVCVTIASDASACRKGVIVTANGKISLQ